MPADPRQPVFDAVRAFRDMVVDFQSRNNAVESGLLVPESSMTRAREFTQRMDAQTKLLMSAFPEFTPVDWETLIDLVPNVRKML